MTGFRLWGFATGVLIVIVYAVGSGLWVQTSGPWYSTLARPSSQPPDVVFGLIWPYNFIMLGVAAYSVSQRLERGVVISWLIVLASSVIAALVWSQQFYMAHNLVLATVALALAALLTLPVLVITWSASPLVGALLLPYQVWVLIATSLSFGYARLN